MKITIDRFEGAYAVCEKEDRTMINVQRSKLPSGAKEGDVLDVVGSIFKVDLAETEKRSKEARKLMDELQK